ncbi:hypothetical protein [Trichothermofontia sp.]
MGVFSDLHHAFKLGQPTRKSGKPSVASPSSTRPQPASLLIQVSPWRKVPPKGNQVSAWSGPVPHLTQRWYHWFYLCALDRPTADGRYSPRFKPDYTHELYLGVLNRDTQVRSQ